MPWRRFLIAYAFLNAVLYSLLLPLWEGFDEPFHFGYVQQLANGQGLPDPRTTRLSGELGAHFGPPRNKFGLRIRYHCRDCP